MELEVDISAVDDAEDEDDDDDPVGPDWLYAVPVAVDVGTDMAWETVKGGADQAWEGAKEGAGWTRDGAGWAWDGVSDGAGWVWGHGGEGTWNFLAGDAIGSCRDDAWSFDCTVNVATTIPFFKPAKALKYGDDVVDVFNRGDDVADTAKTIDKAKDATKRPFNGLGPVQRGRRAMEQLGLKQNTEVLSINGRDRIPDVYSAFPRVIGEVKNVRRLAYTRQLRDYVDFAQKRGIKLDLYVRGAPNPTKLTKPLQAAVDRKEIRLLEEIIE